MELSISLFKFLRVKLELMLDFKILSGKISDGFLHLKHTLSIGLTLIFKLWQILCFLRHGNIIDNSSIAVFRDVLFFERLVMLIKKFAEEKETR